MNHSGSAPPFAIFFPLAALQAAIVGCGWIAALLDGWATAELADWHGRALLFGFVAAAMAGFLLTALPRWTGRPLAKGAVPAVLVCWLAAQLAPFLPAPAAPLSALPSVMLALVAAIHVLRARNRRNVKTVLLLALYSSAAMISCSSLTPDKRAFATRFAIVAVLGLIVLIGGRIMPALTARFDELCGEPASKSRGTTIERLSAITAAAGLGCWLFAPEVAASALILLAAGLAELLRMASWLGRRTTASPPLLALYAAYASLPLGFGLFAFHAFVPDTAPEMAGLHVWTLGGLGGMSLAIMSSMIRKRCQSAFAPSAAAEAAVALCLLAAGARAGASFANESRAILIMAAIAWSAAFALFLWAFRAPLVKTLSTARRRNRRT